MTRKIILIEDDEDACMLFKHFLTTENFDVQHYFDGNAFFDCDDHVADLYILDINLPGIDGLALTKYFRTREESRHTPILVISANHVLQGKAMNAGASAFVPKPFELSDFLNLVKDLVESPSYQT